jgi:hypothetical protein
MLEGELVAREMTSSKFEGEIPIHGNARRAGFLRVKGSRNYISMEGFFSSDVT